MFPPQVWAQQPGPQVVPPTIVGPNAAPAATAAAAEAKTAEPAKEEKKPVVVRKDREPLRNAYHVAAWKVGYLLRRRLSTFLANRFNEDFAYFQPYAHCGSPFDKEVSLKEAVQALTQAQNLFGKFLKDRESEIGTLGFFSADKRAKDEVVSNGKKCQPYFASEMRLSADESRSSELTDKLLSDLYGAGKAFLEPPMLDLLTIADASPASTLEIRRYLELTDKLRRFANSLLTHAKTFHMAEGINSLPDLVISPELGEKLARINGDRPYDTAAEKFKESGLGKIQSFRADEYMPRFVKCGDKSTVCGMGKDSETPSAQFCFCDSKSERVAQMDDDILLALQPQNPDEPTKRPHSVYLEGMRKLGIKGALVQLAGVNSSLRKEWNFEVPNACKNSPVLKEYLALYQDILTLPERDFWIGNLKKSVAAYQKDLKEGRAELPVPVSQNFRSFYTEANSIVEKTLNYVSERYRVSRETVNLVKTMGGLLPFESRITEGDKTRGTDLAALFGDKLLVWSLLIQTELSNLSETQWRTRNALIKDMVRDVLVATYSDALFTYLSAISENRITEVDGKNPLTIAWKERFQLEWENYLNSQVFSRYLDEGLVGNIATRLLEHEAFDKVYNQDEQAELISEARAKEMMPLASAAVVADEAAQYQATNEHRQGAPSALPGTDGLLGYVNPFNSLNYYYQEGQFKNVTQAPACFQVPDGTGREGMYSQFKLNPLYNYNLQSGDVDPVTEFDYQVVKGGLQSILSRQTDKLETHLKEKGYSDALVRSSFAQEVTSSDGKTKTVRIENAKTLGAALIKKMNETLEADPSKDKGVLQSSRSRSLGLIRSWYLNQDSARTYYEQSVIRNAGIIFEKNLRSILEAKPEPVTAEWNKSFANLLNRIADEELLITKMTPERVTQVLSDYELFSIEEKQLEALDKVLTEINDVEKSVLRKNQAIDSAAKWVDFCLNIEKQEKKTCLAWFDETLAPILQSEYLDKYFEEKAQHEGASLLLGSELNPGFVHFYGKGKEKFAGEKTIEELKKLSTPKAVDSLEKITLELTERSFENGKEVLKPVVVDGFYDDSAEVAQNFKGPWYIVKRTKGSNAGKSSVLAPASVRISTTFEKFANLRAKLWLADGVDPKGQWIKGRLDTALTPLVGSVTLIPKGTLNLALVGDALKAKQKLDAIQIARRGLLRDAFWGYDISEFDTQILLTKYVRFSHHARNTRGQLPTDEEYLKTLETTAEVLADLKKSIPNPLAVDPNTREWDVPNDHLKEIDVFLVELSKRLQAKGNEKKSLGEVVQGIRYHVKKFFKDKSIANSWRGTFENAKTAIQNAIQSPEDKRRVELTNVFPHVRYLFHYLPLYLTRRGQTPGTPTWAKEKYYPILADALFPTFEQFVTELKNRIDIVALSNVDPIAEIKSVNDELNTIRMTVWQLEQKEYGYGPMASAEKRSDRKALEKATERVKTLEERRLALREVRDAYAELDRILVHYLGDLDAVREAREGLAKVNQPGLWRAYFEDQFLTSRAGEWGNQLSLTPQQLINDLNEVAKKSAPTIAVNPNTAIEFLDDVKNVCETSRFAPFAQTVNTSYYRSLVTMVSEVLALSQLDTRSPVQEKRLGEAKARLEMLWDLGRKNGGFWTKGQFTAWYESLLNKVKTAQNEGQKPEVKKLKVEDFINIQPKKEEKKSVWNSLQDFFKSANPIPAYQAVGTAFSNTIVGAIEASQFPTLTDTCEALTERAEKLKADIANENEATTLSREKSQQYLNDVVLPVTTIWLSAQSQLAPIYVNGETDTAKRIVWFRRGPVTFKTIGGEQKAGEDKAERITRTLGEFFGQNHLKAKELEAIFKDAKDYTATALKNENAIERVAFINRLSGEERAGLYDHLRDYLDTILLEREAAQEKPFSSEEFSGDLNVPGLVMPGSEEMAVEKGEPAEATKAVVGQTTPAIKAAAPATKPAVVKQPAANAPVAKPQTAQPKTAPANVAQKPTQATAAPTLPAAQPGATAPKTAAATTAAAEAAPSAQPVLPPTAVVPDYVNIFPEGKLEGLTYEKWKAELEAYISLWDDFKKAEKEPFAGAIDSYDSSAALYWLSDAIVAHFIKHTPYEVYRAKVAVPRNDGQTVFSVYGGPVSRNSKEQSLAQFDEYKNAQRIQIVEDIIALYRAEQVRILKDLVVARAEKVSEQRRLGLYSTEQSEVKASEIRPFETGSLAFAPTTTTQVETPEIKLLRFYANHFSSYQGDLDSDKNEGVSLASWKVYANAKFASGDSLVRLSSDESKQFFWSWEPRGKDFKKFSSLPQFNEWLNRLSGDPKANEAFAAMKKQSTTRSRVWHQFASLEETKNSKLVADIKNLIALADEQAKVTTDAQTYPYFLALLNWNLNRYGVVPELKEGKNFEVLKDRYLAGMTRNVVDYIGWDLKHYNGWEWILKERGTVQDWKSVAERKRDFMIGIKSRAMLLTNVEATFVENPEYGVSYGYRPTPVHPGERTLSLPFKTVQEYRAWLSNPQEYLAYRVNGDSYERALYKQLVSLKGEMTGEWHLQKQNPNARGTLRLANATADSYTFGIEGTNVPTSRLTEIGKRAETLGIQTSEGELRRIIAIREKWLDFRRKVDELRRGYDFEGAVLFSGRNNSVVNVPGSTASKVTLDSAAGQLNQLLKRYAAQLKYPESVSIDFALFRDNYAMNAHFHADKIAEWAMYEGQGDRTHIAKVMALLDGYYQEKNTGFEMQKGIFKIGQNLVGRLDKLCNLDVSGVDTDEQLEVAVHKYSRILGVAFWEEDGLLTESELLYMDGLLEKINEALPEGENSETYRRLVELKTRKGLWQGRWEKYGQPVANVAMVAILSYLFMGKNPAGKLGMTATGVNYLINLTFAASFLWEVGREIDQLYIGGPNKLATLIRIRDTRIDDYLNLMRDESGLSLAGEERALDEHRGSYMWWGLRVWMAVSAFEMAGINVRNLRGRWNQVVRWLRPEYYARKERAWILKELKITEAQFKNTEDLAKRIGELIPLIEKKTAARFAETLNGYAVEGDILLPADVAKAYERWLEAKLYWTRNNEAAAEVVARLETALAEVRSAHPFLSQDSLLFLHAQGTGAYVELMPTWLKFVTHEDIYAGFTRLSTAVGRATGVQSLIRPAGVLAKAGNVGLADQKLRQLLLLERVRVWRASAEETLKPLLEHLYEGRSGNQELKAFLRATANPKDEIHAKIEEYVKARLTGRESFGGGSIGTAQASDMAENQARDFLARDVKELNDIWTLSGLSAEANSKEFEKMLTAIAEADYATLAYTLTAPNRMITNVPPFIPREEKVASQQSSRGWFRSAFKRRVENEAVHAAGGEPSELIIGGEIYHLPGGQVWAGATTESTKLAKSTAKWSKEVGRPILKEVAGPLAPKVEKILDQGLSSTAIGRRAGILKAADLLDEEGMKVYRLAYEMSRAMELGNQDFLRLGLDRENFGVYQETFNVYFRRLVGKSDATDLNLAESMGVLFLEREMPYVSMYDIASSVSFHQQFRNPAILDRARQMVEKQTEILLGNKLLSMDDLAFVLGINKETLSGTRIWETISRDANSGSILSCHMGGIDLGRGADTYRTQLRGLTSNYSFSYDAEKLLLASPGETALIKENAEKLRQEVRALFPNQFRLPGDRLSQLEATIDNAEAALLKAPVKKPTGVEPSAPSAANAPTAANPPPKRGFKTEAPQTKAPSTTEVKSEAAAATSTPAATESAAAATATPGKRGFKTPAPQVKTTPKSDAPELKLDFKSGIPSYRETNVTGSPLLKPYVEANYVSAATLKKLEDGASIGALLREAEMARGAVNAGTEEFGSLTKQITELRLVQGAQWLESSVEAGLVTAGSEEYNALKDLFLQRYVRSPLQSYIPSLAESESLLLRLFEQDLGKKISAKDLNSVMNLKEVETHLFEQMSELKKALPGGDWKKGTAEIFESRAAVRRVAMALWVKRSSVYTNMALGLESSSSMPLALLMDSRLANNPQLIGYFVQGEKGGAEALTTKFLESFGSQRVNISLGQEDGERIARAIHDYSEILNTAETLAYETGRRTESLTKEIGELRTQFTGAYFRGRVQYVQGNPNYPKFVEAPQFGEEAASEAKQGQKLLLPGDKGYGFPQ